MDMEDIVDIEMWRHNRGNEQIVAVIGVGQYVRLGTTVDDAMGEAFDKVAKMLSLPYPGGPEVERAAENGNPKRFAFPRPMLGRPDANFSLSGLKTAVRNEASRITPLEPQDISDLCAGFQAAVLESEGEKQAAINRAQGEATALRLIAEANAAAVRAVGEAMSDKGGLEAANLKIAQEYVLAFGNLANKANTMIIPASANDLASFVATAMTVLDKTRQAQDAARSA